MKRQKSKRVKFTDSAIRRLPSKDKVYEVYEENRSSGSGSLGVRVFPTGKRNFFIMYRNTTGNIRRYKLGTHGDITAKQAKNLASEIMGKVAAGEDPQADRQALKQTDGVATRTVGNLWKMHLKDRERNPKSASTMRAEKGYFTRIIEPAIGKMKVKDVDKTILQEILDDYADSGARVAANRCYAFLSKMFGLAVKKNWIDANPMSGVDKPFDNEKKYRPRRRFSDKELKKIWLAMDATTGDEDEVRVVSQNMTDILRLILLTCQRPGEVCQMEWDHVDLEAETWIQPTNKTDEEHLVPLSYKAMEIIGRRYDNREDDRFVFPSRRSSKTGELVPVTDTKSGRLRVQKESGVTNWRSHDLRKAGRSLLSRVEVPHHVRERIINHAVSNDVENTYDLYDYQREKREALDDLASKLDGILGKKVIPIKRRVA